MSLMTWFSGFRTCILYTVPMSRSITLFAYDGIAMIDLVGPSDVFTIANQRAGEALYSLQVVGMGRSRSVKAESGLRLGVDGAIQQQASTHTFIVPGGDGVQPLLQRQAVIRQIARLAGQAERVASICTGAFLLAEAGLLDGRRVTTHWAHARELACRYPDVDVVADALFIEAGSVTTSGGMASGIDLALSLVARDHGEALARETSQRMVLYLNRSGGQSQFSERYEAGSPGDIEDSLDELLSSISHDPTGNLCNAVLASRLSLGERHFSRLFTQRTGSTPARWVERVRVDHARRILETGMQPMGQVARQSGFSSVDTLRQAFRRVVGVSPTQYRLNHALPGGNAH